MLYAVAIVVHVLVAVLAVGLVGAIPITARLARKSAGQLVGVEKILGALLRAMQVGFVVMLLTGMLIDRSASGAFHRTGWFKASIVVLVVIGFSHARARAALRRGNALDRVEQWGWAMCASVALIVILMQMKPFS
jgi:hypothetical protein